MRGKKSVLVGLVVGVVAGATWTAGQSSYPIQLDTPSPSAPAPLGAQILDDLVVTATSPALGPTETVVPISELEARCADEEGCELRLSLRQTGSTFGAEELEARLFATSDAGTQWRAFFYDGTSDGSGTIADSTTEWIMRLTASINECRFEDNGFNNDYRVVSFNDLPTSEHDCVLRVRD